MKHIFASVICVTGILFSLSALPALAQNIRIFDENIHTVVFKVDGNALGGMLPVLQKNGMQELELSFDDLTHEYRRFVYKLEHCERNWTTSSGLFESDYVESTGDDVVIDDYTPSTNTDVLYTHYVLRLPNSMMNPQLSGNYRLTIYCDDGQNDEPEKAIEACFCITDPKVSISLNATTNTDIDWNGTHQQLQMEINTIGLPRANAAEDLTVVIMQNYRTDNFKIAPPPTSVIGGKLIWEHCPKLIFDAGNEYRKLEMLRTHDAGLHIDRMRWDDTIWHAFVQPDAPRQNYLYDEDQNGRYVIRNTQGGDNETESQYVVTHFRLETDEIPNAQVFLNGWWTYGEFTPRFRMDYNYEGRCYEADILLKQGYYSYQYLLLPDGIDVGLTAPIEGNYFQTENEYTVLVYYRNPVERYDQLIGMKHFKFKP